MVDLRRRRVTIAHTAASVETMKRVRIEAEVSRFAFWLILTKYASMPSVGISVTISNSRQKVKKM